MPVIQPTLFVPDFLQAGIDSGTLFRNGSVVRDAGGRIISHLQETRLVNKAVQETAAFTRNPWVALGVGVGVLVSAGFATYGIVEWKRGERALAEYNVALVDYLKAAQKAALSEPVVRRLRESVDSLTGIGRRRVVAVFTSEQFGLLLSSIELYTERLLGANGIAASRRTSNVGQPIERLREILRLQEEIFKPDDETSA